MMNAQASNASPRCPLATTTMTMGSVGRSRPYPVHDPGVEDVPALGRVAADPLDGALGHPGIVLQRHLADVAALVDVAHEPHERGDRPHLRVGAVDLLDERAGVERRFLDADRVHHPSRSANE